MNFKLPAPLGELRWVDPLLLYWDGNRLTEVTKIEVLYYPVSNVTIFELDLANGCRLSITVDDDDLRRDGGLNRWMTKIGKMPVGIKIPAEAIEPGKTFRQEYFGTWTETAPVGPVRETCPECYGTGWRNGFGRPCSKGCKIT